MGEEFKLEVVNPEKSFLSKEDVTEVVVPAFEGEMGILKDHISIISFLKPGIIKVYSKTGEEKYYVEDGIIEFKNNNLSILTSSIFNIKDIEKNKIDEMLREAEEEIKKANYLLNRKWEIIGKVVKGSQRGRKIGFPTCNILLKKYIIPKFGVYAVNVKINDISKKGIANVGYRPTFNGKKLLLEVNIFGIKKNLYNKNINVIFNKFIRPEKKFKNIIELKNQIKKDIKQAK